MIINNNLYNFSFEQLCLTYQNHVLCNNTYKFSSLVWWLKHTILKLIMENTMLMPPIKSATPFLPLWSSMDALSLLAIVFFITCIMPEKTLWHVPIELLKHKQRFPDKYFHNVFDVNEVICYLMPSDNRDMLWKFALTNSMIFLTPMLLVTVFCYPHFQR